MVAKAWMLLLIAMAAAGARADCDACVAGRCHSRRPLLRGYHITNQLAIDRTSNILYVHLKPDVVTAIFLDEPKRRTFSVANTTKGLAVDQATQTVYSSHDGFIYGHTFENDVYITKTAYILDRPTTPAKLRYEDTLYTINEDGSVAYWNRTASVFVINKILKDYILTDVANVANATIWYFISDNTLYQFMWDIEMEILQVLANKKYVLSVGRFGDVYFGDASNKVIYKLDRKTKQLIEYVTYKSGSVQDFVFDKGENIVFRDVDGNVAQWQWVPDAEGVCVLKN